MTLRRGTRRLGLRRSVEVGQVRQSFAQGMAEAETEQRLRKEQEARRRVAERAVEPAAAKIAAAMQNDEAADRQILFDNRAEFDAACQRFREEVIPIIEWVCAKEWGLYWHVAYEERRKEIREKYASIPKCNGRIDWDISDLLEAVEILWPTLDQKFFKGTLDKSSINFLRAARNKWAHAREINNVWFTTKIVCATLQKMIQILQALHGSSWKIHVQLLELEQKRA